MINRLITLTADLKMMRLEENLCAPVKEKMAKTILILITSGTLLLRFRAYKAKNGERFFRCGTPKNPP